jgi:hypothetical protein
MQDDQIGQKIAGLAPADMARLHTPFHYSNKNIFSDKQPHLSAGTAPTLNLPCFMYKGNRPFLLVHSTSM